MLSGSVVTVADKEVVTAIFPCVGSLTAMEGPPALDVLAVKDVLALVSSARRLSLDLSETVPTEAQVRRA